MAKQKISRFEYAIKSIADPEGSKDFEPYTEKEEYSQRLENIRSQIQKLKPIIKTTEDG